MEIYLSKQQRNTTLFTLLHSSHHQQLLMPNISLSNWITSGLTTVRDLYKYSLLNVFQQLRTNYYITSFKYLRLCSVFSRVNWLDNLLPLHLIKFYNQTTPVVLSSLWWPQDIINWLLGTTITMFLCPQQWYHFLHAPLKLSCCLLHSSRKYSTTGTSHLLN